MLRSSIYQRRGPPLVLASALCACGQEGLEIEEVAPAPAVAEATPATAPPGTGHFSAMALEFAREQELARGVNLGSLRQALEAEPPETLREYAAKCDVATGVHVPAFNCEDGTEVPGQEADSQGKCNQPNRLNRECDPGSHFQVLVRTESAVVVAHCRKDGQPVDNNLYNDIAVIQYNKDNGAACFYQALTDLDGHVAAPSRGEDVWPWKTPAQTHAIDCGGCHDTGGIIRSPYLAQLDSGDNALPGAPVPGTGGAVALGGFNNKNPLSYIGLDFQDWQTHRVEANAGCTGCHNLAVNNVSVFGAPVGTRGTAREFAVTATARSERSKRDHGPDSPIWMLPGQVFYDPDVAARAQKYSDCAKAFTDGASLPADCSVEPLSSPWTGITPAVFALL
jgi:hypothetical protein